MLIKAAVPTSSIL